MQQRVNRAGDAGQQAAALPIRDVSAQLVRQQAHRVHWLAQVVADHRYEAALGLKFLGQVGEAPIEVVELFRRAIVRAQQARHDAIENSGQHHQQHRHDRDGKDQTAPAVVQQYRLKGQRGRQQNGEAKPQVDHRNQHAATPNDALAPEQHPLRMAGLGIEEQHRCKRPTEAVRHRVEQAHLERALGRARGLGREAAHSEQTNELAGDEQRVPSQPRRQPPLLGLLPQQENENDGHQQGTDIEHALHLVVHGGPVDQDHAPHGGRQRRIVGVEVAEQATARRLAGAALIDGFSHREVLAGCAAGKSTERAT